jgi:hypothetical protein
VTDSKTKMALAIAGPVLLAVAYLWGVVYHDVRMAGWGFGSFAVSLSPQEVYMQAFVAAMSVIRRPMDWLNALPLSLSLAFMAGTMVVGGFVGWLSMSPRLIRWRKPVEGTDPAPIADTGPAHADGGHASPGHGHVLAGRVAAVERGGRHRDCAALFCGPCGCRTRLGRPSVRTLGPGHVDHE